MRKSIISMAVAGLFMPEQGEGEQNGGGAEAKANAQAKAEAKAAKQFAVEIPAEVKSWQEQGQKEGKRVSTAEQAGERLAANIALVYGEKLGGQPSAADFLTGYASNWSNPDTAKSRKTNMKLVFDAFAIGNEERKMLIGYDEGGGMVHGVKKVSEWLKIHNELEVELVKGKKTRLYSGYSGLLRMAKAMKGGTSASTTTTGTSTKAVRLTDKQTAEFIERLPAASINVAAQIAEKATAQLLKVPGFEIALFQQISMVSNMLKAKSTDLRYLKVAGEITDLVNGVIDAARADEAKMLAKAGQVAHQGTAAATPPAPASETVPAEKERKAA